eukprot:366131-Chlamydomonas_euryale.AAC.40
MCGSGGVVAGATGRAEAAAAAAHSASKAGGDGSVDGDGCGAGAAAGVGVCSVTTAAAARERVVRRVSSLAAVAGGALAAGAAKIATCDDAAGLTTKAGVALCTRGCGGAGDVRRLPGLGVTLGRTLDAAAKPASGRSSPSSESETPWPLPEPPSSLASGTASCAVRLRFPAGPLPVPLLRPRPLPTPRPPLRPRPLPLPPLPRPPGADGARASGCCGDTSCVGDPAGPARERRTMPALDAAAAVRRVTRRSTPADAPEPEAAAPEVCPGVVAEGGVEDDNRS